MVQQTVADMFDEGDDDDDDDNNDLEDTPACLDARHLTRAHNPRHNLRHATLLNGELARV